MINAGRSKARRRDPAGSLRASWSLLQEYSQKREAAEIPVPQVRRAAAAAALKRSTQAPTPSTQTRFNTQTRELTPSILAHERHDAVQRRHRELLVAQDVVIRMLRPHADARREI